MALISMPVMMRYGYNMRYVTGVLAASGTITQLVPPSLVLIVMADQLGRSVGDMYQARGARRSSRSLLFARLHLHAWHRSGRPTCRRCRETRTLTGWALWRKCLLGIIPSAVLIFVVLGTMMMGLATPTEAGAMGAIGAIVLAAIHHKDFSAAGSKILDRRRHRRRYRNHRRDPLQRKRHLQAGVRCRLPRHRLGLPRSGPDSGPARPDPAGLRDHHAHHLHGGVHPDRLDLLLGGVPRRVRRRLARAHADLACPGGVWGFLIFVNLFIFFLAFFLDFFEIAFIILPMIAPIAQKILAPVVGPDAALIWFGVMLCVNMQTSFMHPPFGFALFYLRGVAPKEVKSSDIYWGAVPWIGLQAIMVLLVIAFPITVTALLDKPLDVDLSKVKIEVPQIELPPLDFGAEKKQ